MEYGLFRQSILNIRKLAENYTSLNQSELQELNRLNSQCLTMKEGMVKSFRSVIGELEDGLTLLIDRLEQMKKDVDKISGPEGTLEDTLQLEPAWQNSENLLNNIRILLNPGTHNPGNKDNKSATSDLGGTTIHELVVMARNEAAIAGDKATAENLPSTEVISPPKILKSEGQGSHLNIKKQDEQNNTKKALQRKDQRITHTGHFNAKPMPVNKSCGDTEKKIIDEISKNMELIKGNKKKL